MCKVLVQKDRKKLKVQGLSVCGMSAYVGTNLPCCLSVSLRLKVRLHRYICLCLSEFAHRPYFVSDTFILP